MSRGHAEEYKASEWRSNGDLKGDCSYFFDIGFGPYLFSDLLKESEGNFQ